MHSIFVSSTFRDMHFERDILNRAVSAKLNRRLSAHNQSIRLLDLRWGVDTSELSEEEATERVLRVCFDTIESCKPYMIILLGDRYGYVPGEDGLSVTHMEILKGAIQSATPEHVFIYMRQTDYSQVPEQLRCVYTEQNPQAQQQLAALKAELWKTLPDRCRYYTATWSDEQQLLVAPDFEEMVYNDLEQDLLKSLSLKQYHSELHKQLSENDEILADNLQFAYCDRQALNAQLEQIQSADKPVCISGQAGAGKSVYMSLLCAQVRQMGHPAYILFCGDNAFSASVRNAAEAVLYALTCASGEDYDFAGNAELSYEQLLQRMIRQREKVQRKSYIFLDAVDKCENGMVSFLMWCRRFLSQSISLVFSSRLTPELEEVQQSFRLMPMLYDRAGLEGMAQSLLNKYGKTVNTSLIRQVCQKAETPLQLHVLLLRLLNLNSDDFSEIEQQGGGMDAINAYLEKLIAEASPDLDDLLEDYLAVQLNNSENPDLAVLILCLLVFSEQGFTESDLQALVGLTTLSWVQMDYMAFLAEFAFFIRSRENGRLDLSHDVIRTSFRKVMKAQKKMICAMLTDYFSQVEDPTPATVSAFFHAAYLGKQHRAVVEYIMKNRQSFYTLDAFSQLCGAQMRKSLSRILLEDPGYFLLEMLNTCSGLEEVCFLQSAISSALLRLNDYLSEEEITRVLKLCTIIPLQVEAVPAELALLEVESCRKFLERHHVTQPELHQFLDKCEESFKQRSGGASIPSDQDNTTEQLLSVLQDDSQDMTQRTIVLNQLCQLGRKMAGSNESAETAKDLLNTLLTVLNTTSLSLTADIAQITRADIYTSLGVAAKTTRQWEQGIAWDKESEKIYKTIYENTRTPDMFRKYRSRVYNIANIIEAWAMQEKTNQALWARARDSYARVYDLDMQAVAQGIPERELMQCASAILSYGTALINSGDYADGIRKFHEGIDLVLELTANNPRAELYLEICLHQMECAYVVCMSEKYDVALTLCSDISRSIQQIIATGTPEHKKQLMQYVAGFGNHINTFQSQLAQKRDLDNILILYRISEQVFLSLLPIGHPEVNRNVTIVQRNIGNFLLQQGQYEEAYETYQQLIRLVQEQDLLAADENGNFNDHASLSTCNVFARSLFCLEKLDRKDQIKPMLDSATPWAQFICDHTNTLAGDPARVLYMMGADLSHIGSQLGLLFIMLAFHAIQEEGYDKQKNIETVMMVLKALGQDKDEKE